MTTTEKAFEAILPLAHAYGAMVMTTIILSAKNAPDSEQEAHDVEADKVLNLLTRSIRLAIARCEFDQATEDMSK